MIYVIFIVLLGMIFLSIKYHTRNLIAESYCTQIVSLINTFLLIAPVIGLIIFTILFTTVLEGRIYERATHAYCLLFLWIISTSLYTEIMKHYKNKKVVFISIVCIILSVALTIALTPLDIYNLLIYSKLKTFSFAIGVYLMLIFYVGIFISRLGVSLEISSNSN